MPSSYSRLAAEVYRTTGPTGSPAINHAKFIIIDRALTLLTSANFSYSAENTNIELRLLVHDTALAESIELQLCGKHGILYERVRSSQGWALLRSGGPKRASAHTGTQLRAPVRAQ